MNIELRKLTIIEKLIRLHNEEIISQFENLLAKIKQKEENEIQPMTIDEFNKRIDQSMEDSVNGRLTENDELISEIEKWS